MKIEITDSKIKVISDGSKESSHFLSLVQMEFSLLNLSIKNEIELSHSDADDLLMLVNDEWKGLNKKQITDELFEISERNYQRNTKLKSLNETEFEDFKGDKDFEEFVSKLDSNLNISFDENEFIEITKKQTAKVYSASQLENTLNFSQPGSGKTLMTLMGLVHRMRKGERVVIVSPINAMNVWKGEIKKFLNWQEEEKSVHFFHNQLHPKFSDHKESAFTDFAKSNFILINYESVQNLINHGIIMSFLKECGYHLVFDEAHRIKSGESIRNKWSKILSDSALSRTILTGTPFSKNVDEIKQMINLAWPKGNPCISDSLLEELAGDIQLGEMDVDHAFLEMTDKTKEDLKILNEKIKPLYFSLNKERDFNITPADDLFLTPQIVKPLDIQVKLDKIISEKIGRTRFLLQNKRGREREEIKKILNALQLAGEQNVTNPFLLKEWLSFERYFEEVEEVPFKELPKMKEAIKMVKELTSKEKKVMIWLTFVDNIIKLKQSLIDEGIITEEIHGNTAPEERERIIESFSNPSSKIQVLISNPSTIAESISLHKSVSDSIFIERSFSYFRWAQAKDRIHRVGSKNKVTHNYIKNSGLHFEDKLFENLHKKDLVSKEIFFGDIVKSVTKSLTLTEIDKDSRIQLENYDEFDIETFESKINNEYDDLPVDDKILEIDFDIDISEYF